MKPGIYEGITNADYHGGPGTSISMLNVLHDRSALHLHHLLTSEEERESTADQSLGTAFHARVLEPAEFVKNYTLGLRPQDAPGAIMDRDTLVTRVEQLNATRLPKLATGGNKDDQVARICGALRVADGTLVTVPKLGADGFMEVDLASLKSADLKAILEKMNRERQGMLPTSGSMQEMADLLRANGQEITLWSDVKAEWQRNNGHRLVLESDTWEQVHAMRDSVMAHPIAGKLLAPGLGVAERSVYWTDPTTGELCRCRPDYWRQDLGLLVDLKSTEDASLEGFQRSIQKWKYYRQDPWYLDGVNLAIKQSKRKINPVTRFIFVAVEKKAPYAVGVYTLDEVSQQLGRVESAQDLALWHECRVAGKYPGYGDAIQNISLPQWHLNRNANLLAPA